MVVEPPTKFSKKAGGLTGSQFSERDCESGGDIFQGVAVFTFKK